eukprot:UN13378
MLHKIHQIRFPAPKFPPQHIYVSNFSRRSFDQQFSLWTLFI